MKQKKKGGQLGQRRVSLCHSATHLTRLVATTAEAVINGLAPLPATTGCVCIWLNCWPVWRLV